MNNKVLRINKDIIDIFESIVTDNITDLLTQVANKYGDKYGFTEEDLIDEFLPKDEMLISVISDNLEIKQRKSNKISYIQKHSVTTTKKCIARTWSGGKGLQCTRTAATNKDFCRTHQNQLDNNKLWQGTIHDEINKVEIVYKTNLAKKNKRKKK